MKQIVKYQKVQDNLGGFALVEILMAILLGSVVAGGTFKVLEVSLKSSNVARSSLNEQELTVIIGNILNDEKSCKANLDTASSDFTKIDGTGVNERWRLSNLKKDANQDGDISDADDNTLLTVGQDFQGSLEVVDMQLRGGGSLDRRFIVFYKKKNMGNLNTLGGGSNCDSSDQSDCYYAYCDLNYDPVPPSGTPATCANPSCVYFNAGSSAAADLECYKVTDSGDSPNRVSLIGCGEASQINQEKTTAIGFGAGRRTNQPNGTFVGYYAGDRNTGTRNTIVGYYAGAQCSGNSNTAVGNYAGNSCSGQDNVMFGDQAGRQNSGNYNVFVGARAGYHGYGSYSNSGDYNVFIGNRSNSNTSSSNTGSGNTFIGNETGKNNTTGRSNVFIGNTVGEENTEGRDNIFVGGGKRGQGVTTGDKNIFIGGTRSGGLSKTGGPAVKCR